MIYYARAHHFLPPHPVGCSRRNARQCASAHQQLRPGAALGWRGPLQHPSSLITQIRGTNHCESGAGAGASVHYALQWRQGQPAPTRRSGTWTALHNSSCICQHTQLVVASKSELRPACSARGCCGARAGGGGRFRRPRAAAAPEGAPRRWALSVVHWRDHRPGGGRSSRRVCRGRRRWGEVSPGRAGPPTAHRCSP